jgi:thiol-disulfide isomerase/thioredoxin
VSQDHASEPSAEPSGASHPLRWRRPAWIVLAAFGLAAAVGVALVGSGDGGSVAQDSGAVFAVQLQSFEGEPFTLERYRGHPLVVNFFASWCGPCAREMPAFARVHDELDGEVAFVGVNIEDNPQAARALVERSGVAYDLGRDDGSLFKALGGVAMPTTAFIGSDGVVASVHSGELSQQGLERAVRMLLES